jgi:hypothetical protein
VAKSAAYACQVKALRLKTHESPPCHVNNPNTLKKDERAAAKLLRRMRRHGVSEYHPDPMAAIDAAKDTASGPRVTAWAVELFKMACRGCDVRTELHAALGLGPQHVNVLDMDIDADPPPALAGRELEDWKLVQRLLGRLIAPP